MSNISGNAPPGESSSQTQSRRSGDSNFQTSLLQAVSEDIAGNRDGKYAAAGQINSSIPGANARVGSEQAYVAFLKKNFSKYDLRSSDDKAQIIKFAVTTVNDTQDILAGISKYMGGNKDASLISISLLRKLYGLRDIRSGQESAYIEHLKKNNGRFSSMSNADKISALQESIDAVNSKSNAPSDRSVLADIESRIAGQEASNPLTADRLNGIGGITGARDDQTENYVQYLKQNFPQFKFRNEGQQIDLLQYVIDTVNQESDSTGNTNPPSSSGSSNEQSNAQSENSPESTGKAGPSSSNPRQPDSSSDANSQSSSGSSNEQSNAQSENSPGSSGGSGPSSSNPGQSSSSQSSQSSSGRGRGARLDATSEATLDTVVKSFRRGSRSPMASHDRLNALDGVKDAQETMENKYLQELRSKSPDFETLSSSEKVTALQGAIDSANNKNFERVMSLLADDVVSQTATPKVTAADLNSLVGVDGVKQENIRFYINDLFYRYRREFARLPISERVSAFNTVVTARNNQQDLLESIERRVANEDTENEDMFTAAQLNELFGSEIAKAGYEEDYLEALRNTNFKSFVSSRMKYYHRSMLEDFIPYRNLTQAEKTPALRYIVNKVNREKES